jgi:hypothetical protein
VTHPNTALPSDVAPMRAAVLTRMAADNAFRDPTESSVERILRAKERFNPSPACP